MKQFMRVIQTVVLTVFLSLPSLALAGVISPARVNLIDGDVTFRTPESSEWLPASVNTPLDEGDELWTAVGSKAEMQLADGTVIRLDGETQLNLIAVEENFTHLHLASGKLYLKTSPNALKNALQIDADDTTILPDSRTRLRIDMLSNSQEDVAIFKGSAYVEGNGSRTRVRAGEHIALEEGHSELLPLNSPDNWELWNGERDRSQSRSTPADARLPEELQTYSAELDSQGRWISIPEYGVVWRPTVILSEDWAPYRSGRWIWKGDDYVWVSYENWGWAPYHYGRWAIVSGLGWCWVPPARGDIYWGPGYVGWYRSESHVGWTPLAPGENFYGRRNYGRYSINTATTPVNSASVSYKNRNERGGFSILLQNDFLHGRAAFQAPSSAPSVSVAVSLGSPRIRPLQETRMPVVKQIPPRAVPPTATIRHDNRDLRERFPRVTPAVEKQRQALPSAALPMPTTPAVAIRPTPPAPSLPSRQSVGERTRTTPPQPTTSQPVRTDQPTVTPPSHRRTEIYRQDKIPREREQRKVWSVTTTDQGNDKKGREKENKERRGKE